MDEFEPGSVPCLETDDYRRSKGQIERLRKTRRKPRGREHLYLEIAAAVTMGSLITSLCLVVSGKKAYACPHEEEEPAKTAERQPVA